MYVIIAGSRTVTKDEMWYCIELSGISHLITHVISGKAPKGGDFWGEEWANSKGLPIIPFPADWYNLNVPNCYVKPGTNYNSLAGFNRNEEMAVFAASVGGRLIAAKKGKASGTKDMIKRAKAHRIKVHSFTVEE